MKNKVNINLLRNKMKQNIHQRHAIYISDSIRTFYIHSSQSKKKRANYKATTKNHENK